MPRIPSVGRDLEQEKADKMFDDVKKMYERSGANVGPRQPMSEDMKSRIGAEVDKLEKKPRGGGGGSGMMPDLEGLKGRKPKLYKKGGSASSRADGIAQRGKTRGKMC
jgi:hypothetical protein